MGLKRTLGLMWGGVVASPGPNEEKAKWAQSSFFSFYNFFKNLLFHFFLLIFTNLFIQYKNLFIDKIF